MPKASFIMTLKWRTSPQRASIYMLLCSCVLRLCVCRGRPRAQPNGIINQNHRTQTAAAAAGASKHISSGVLFSKQTHMRIALGSLLICRTSSSRGLVAVKRQRSNNSGLVSAVMMLCGLVRMPMMLLGAHIKHTRGHTRTHTDIQSVRFRTYTILYNTPCWGNATHTRCVVQLN